MINLFVESYCQNCPYFEHYDSMAVETQVHCADMNKCDSIHNQIIKDEAKKLGDAIKKM